METFDLILKFGSLFFLTAEAELTFRSKRYAQAIMIFAIWLIMFRLTLLRAMAMYIGVFSYQPLTLLEEIRGVLQSVGVSIVTDSLVLIGAVALFSSIQKNYRDSLRG